MGDQRDELVERLLTVGQVAELLGTTGARRLIEERRIRFVRLGRHVRIPESALREFIEGGLVEPIKPPGRPKSAGVMAGSRRYFGNVRRRESGRYQVRYRAPDGKLPVCSAYVRPEGRGGPLAHAQGS